MISNTQFKNLAKKFGTPLYVYDARVIERQFKKLDKAIKYKPYKIYYAIKANSNLHILRLLKKAGAYMDASSPVEVYQALKAGYKPSNISFTGLNLTKEELRYVLGKKITINADSLSQLENIGKLARGAKVGFRINPVFGTGHHKKVITAGLNSKFGIYYKDTDKVKKIADKYDLKIVGIHQHVGSGILNSRDFLKATNVLFKVAKQFTNLEYLDFGGGLGIPYKPQDKTLDVNVLGSQLSKKFKEFTNNYSNELELRVEPGRFLVAQSGTLLAQVTAIKKTPAGDIVVGTDTGMTHMIRHAMYDAYHEIQNISNPSGKKQKVTIVGNICESSDVFAENRPLAQAREGDILAIKDVGAYGFSMASRFNGRLLPPEVLVRGNRAKLIRRRDTFKDLI